METAFKSIIIDAADASERGKMKTDIVCIGQAVIDCITRGREEDPYQKNVFRAESITLSTGGDAANEAFNLAAMGRHVRLVCGLGEDTAGMLMMNEAKRRGVDTSFITVDPSLQTPVANLMVNMEGSRSSVNSRATMLGEYAPSAEAVKGARIVSLASLFRAPLDKKEVIKAFVFKAKEEGAIVCADTKLPTYRKLSLDDLKDVLPLIDYMFPNENEGAYYTGESGLMEMAEKLRSYGVKNVVIKAGEKGCAARGENEGFFMESLPVKAVDSSGAGDSFVSGFLSALLDGKSFRECCASGTAYAAECVQRVGAVPPLTVFRA